ncbi:hypothetical protein AA313_de0204443 [Arthrobotrys entomopaga]|nr:hypothetical protein AA313_de0204443 [Arthrobotrys entomopaga]
MSQTSDLPALPAVEQALRPFIKSPSEASLIRRHLSSTLASLIASSSSSSLTTQRAVRCLTGTRKAYYTASLENIRLKKQWTELTSDITLPYPPSQTDPPASQTSNTTLQKQQQQQQQQHNRSHSRKISTAPVIPQPHEWPQIYDQVLELRRVFSQLTILAKYQSRITALATSHNKPLAGIFLDYAQRLPPSPPGGPLAKDTTLLSSSSSTTTILGGSGGSGGGVGGNGEDEILLPLEKAVVEAKARLEHEKNLLSQIQDVTKDLNLSGIPQAVKTAGMIAAKEELEVWLDEQLRLAGEESKTPRKEKKDMGMVGVEGSWDGDDGTFNLDVQIEEIKKVYESYVASREMMLHAFLLAIQPVKEEVIPPKTSRDRVSSTVVPTTGLAGGEMPGLLGVMDELGHWKRRMDELTELMRAMKEGGGSAAGELEVMMGKLRSESQLLENYDGGGARIVQQQQQQQHKRGKSMSIVEEESPFQKSVEMAKMWELAAEEAERRTREEVDKDVLYAKQKLEEVEGLVERVRGLLPEEEENASRRRRKEVRWRGLRGNVGFDDM